MLAAILIALAALITAITGLAALFVKVGTVHEDVREVHGLVNSTYQEMVSRVDQLKGVLQGAGLAVPDRLANGTDDDPQAQSR